MKRFALLLLAATAWVGSCASDAQAGQPFSGYGFVPFGFYQPYGAQYGQTLRTPPYFAVNPPVYYGARYSRPYGMSPFASPPLVSAPQGYTGRLRSKAHDGEHTTPEPACNPYICGGQAGQPDQVAVGPVRTNPFIDQSTIELAKN